MQAGSTMGNLASVVDLPSEEATLVAELRAGSEAAFAQLIAQYHQPLYSLIARSLQDPADASDITQEVFIKVFRNIRGFHGESSLRTWLYRIALHEASNQRRWWSRHKRREIAMEAPCCSRCADDADSESQPFGATLADGGCSPFEYAAQEELHERVEACLRQVPEAFRTVVVLREIEGFTYEEIAEVLQVNLGTVKSRLTRGRAALRELLASEKSDLAGAHVATAHRASAPAPVCACLDATAAEQQSLLASRNRPRTHAGFALDSRAGSRLEASR
jgi:RNA polymerase sigma-70 factor (ECF subfamily)